MKTEDVFPGDHHIDALGELVHDYPLDECLLNLDSQNEATSGHIINLLAEVTLLWNSVNFDVFVHKEKLELIHGADKDESLRHVGDQVEQAVLADAEYTLWVRTVLGWVAMEQGYSHVYDVQMVRVWVCI